MILVGERAGCFAFLWSVACVLSVIVCLLFLLVPLVGYDLYLCLFMVIYTITSHFMEIVSTLRKHAYSNI